MNKPTLVYFGTPDFSATVLDRLIAEKFPVLAVVSTPERPTGRKQIVTPTRVAHYALTRSIPVFTPATLRNNSEFAATLTNFKPNIFVVFSYGKIIPQVILDIPTHGCINIHPSRLPRYRGPSPLQAQILAGETEVGVSFITMTQNVDAGDIIAQEAIPMPNQATFASLAHDLADLAATIAPHVLIDWYTQAVTPTPQDQTQATFTSMVTKEDGYIDVATLDSLDQKVVERKIRAYWPWPGCWTSWENKVVKLLPERRMQVEGKSPITTKQFASGYPQAKPWLEHLKLL